MPRTPGARNRDHQARRRELLGRLRERLGREGAPRASWRELAEAAGVGPATLAHHFGRREDVVRAVIEDMGADGAEPLAVLAEPTGPFAASILDALAHARLGLERFGVGEMVAIGLAEGLRQPALGPAFVNATLEPMVQALARRLAAHQERGEMRGEAEGADPRVAALGLLSPLLLAHLHQAQLGGAQTHPLAMDDLARQTAEAFVRSYASGPPARPE